MTKRHCDKCGQEIAKSVDDTWFVVKVTCSDPDNQHDGARSELCIKCFHSLLSLKY